MANNNEDLIRAIADAHNAIERAINTMRNQAVPDLYEMEDRAQGNMAGGTAASLIRDIIKVLKAI